MERFETSALALRGSLLEAWNDCQRMDKQTYGHASWVFGSVLDSLIQYQTP